MGILNRRCGFDHSDAHRIAETAYADFFRKQNEQFARDRELRTLRERADALALENAQLKSTIATLREFLDNRQKS